jgi:hypothetical protein
MRNLLPERVKYMQSFANAVYGEFKKLRYGISSGKSASPVLSEIRKDIINYQANDDFDALTQTSIQHMGWLPVYYASDDETVDYLAPWLDMNKYKVRTSSSPSTVGMSYNYGGTSPQNIIEVNTAGCITRINLNPAITINNGVAAQFTFHQDTPSATWTITHALGFVPNVLTMNESGQEIMGVVNSATTSTLIIQFSEPVTGYAYLS